MLIMLMQGISECNSLPSQPPPYSRRGVNKSVRVHPSFTRVIIEFAPELIEGLIQYSQETLRSSYYASGSISRSAFEAKMLCIQANSGNAVVRRGGPRVSQTQSSRGNARVWVIWQRSWRDTPKRKPGPLDRLSGRLQRWWFAKAPCCTLLRLLYSLFVKGVKNSHSSARPCENG